MLDGIFRGSYPDALKSVLQAASLTHAEVSKNLANLDTPGYQGKHTDFRELLLEQRPDGAPPHGAGFDAYLEEIGQGAEGANLEAELARLSQATLDQAAAVQLLSRRYSLLSQAISEGKRG